MGAIVGPLSGGTAGQKKRQPPERDVACAPPDPESPGFALARGSTLSRHPDPTEITAVPALQWTDAKFSVPQVLGPIRSECYPELTKDLCSSGRNKGSFVHQDDSSRIYRSRNFPNSPLSYRSCHSR